MSGTTILIVSIGGLGLIAVQRYAAYCAQVLGETAAAGGGEPFSRATFAASWPLLLRPLFYLALFGALGLGLGLAALTAAEIFRRLTEPTALAHMFITYFALIGGLVAAFILTLIIWQRRTPPHDRQG